MTPPDSRIHVIRVPPGTCLGDKLNLGIEQAAGTHIAKWDDDDYYAPPYLERMYRFLRSTDAAVTFIQPFTFYDLRADRLCTSDPRRCSGATLFFSKDTWRKNRFRSVPREVDGWFLQDIIDANGGDTRACRGLDGDGTFLQLRHSGHLWQRMPDGSTVDAYLARRPADSRRLEDVVPARVVRVWEEYRAHLGWTGKGAA